MTRFTPNGSLDVYLRDPEAVDELPDPTLCVSESGLPCIGFASQGAAFAAPGAATPAASRSCSATGRLASSRARSIP